MAVSPSMHFFLPQMNADEKTSYHYPFCLYLRLSFSVTATMEWLSPSAISKCRTKFISSQFVIISGSTVSFHTGETPAKNLFPPQIVDD